MAEAPRTLSEVVDCICDVAGQTEHKVSLQAVREAVGGRAFGPLLLMAGVITVTPLSAVPGVPTLLGLCVILIAGQMVLGLKQIWLPRWMLNMRVRAQQLEAVGRGLVKPARFLDRFVRPRLAFVTQGIGRRLVAIACIAVGLVTPLLELVPFSTAVSGAIIAIFGLGLTTRDGVIVLAALGGGGLALGGVGFAAAGLLS